jgi:hypothetical protein
LPARSVARLTDPKALRAYAHPVRMTLIGLLRTRGPLTATQAAKLTGESSGTCSFHLRQLAKYGLVEEAGGGTGRERPWRATALNTSLEGDADDPAAGALVRSALVDVYFERVSRWLDRRGEVTARWRDAALFGDRFLYLTADEMTGLGARITELVDVYAEREVRAEARPLDARLVSMLLFAFPEGRRCDRREGRHPGQGLHPPAAARHRVPAVLDRVDRVDVRRPGLLDRGAAHRRARAARRNAPLPRFRLPSLAPGRPCPACRAQWPENQLCPWAVRDLLGLMRNLRCAPVGHGRCSCPGSLLGRGASQVSHAARRRGAGRSGLERVLVRNHDEKVKDMSRSVLPSKGRESARYRRRAIHKRQRAHELAAVTAYRRDADPESVTPDVWGTHAPDITEMVWNRRAADKVGPLIRWARATIAASPTLRPASVEEQVAYFAGLLPDTTIGRHAIMHIQQDLKWHARWAQYYARPRTAPGRGPQVMETERQLREILAAGLHGALNAELRRLVDRQVVPPRASPTPHRPLLGGHDVAAFAAEMARWPAVRELIAALAAAGRPDAGER